MTIILTKTGIDEEPQPFTFDAPALVVFTADTPRRTLELAAAPDGTAVRFVSLAPALHRINGPGVAVQFDGPGARVELVAHDGAWLVIDSDNASLLSS